MMCNLAGPRGFERGGRKERREARRGKGEGVESGVGGLRKMRREEAELRRQVRAAKPEA